MLILFASALILVANRQQIYLFSCPNIIFFFFNFKARSNKSYFSNWKVIGLKDDVIQEINSVPVLALFFLTGKLNPLSSISKTFKIAHIILPPK